MPPPLPSLEDGAATVPGQWREVEPEKVSPLLNEVKEHLLDAGGVGY
jgi:hypothetical protein